MSELRRIRTIEELSQFLDESVEGPVVLMKHSTRCPASFSAHDELGRFSEMPGHHAATAVVYVVEDRALSNEIATRLGVKHESPQAFVIVDRVVRWHDSHGEITAARLEQESTGAGNEN